MQGIWLEDQKIHYRTDIAMPELQAGEALIRLRLAGICATDLELVKGYYPYTGVLGHEFVGDVISIGAEVENSTYWIGKRVVGEINAACGRCSSCLANRRTHCENRSVLGIVQRNGAFADYFLLPVENLHIVPEIIPDEKAVFIEPLAAALEIQEQIHVRPSDRVLVVGAGRLGQLIAQTLSLTGCDLQVVARRPNQTRLLQDREIRVIAPDQIPQHKLDIIVEATGSQDGFQIARKAVRARGMIVLKSTYHGEMQVNLSSVVVDEVTLVGSRCGPFQPALDLMAAGRVDPTGLIEKRYPLSEAEKAFEHAAEPGVLKILLQP